MVTDPYLGWTHIEQSQSQKEVTANAMGTQISGATQGALDVDCTAGGTITLTAAQYLDNHTFRLTGSPAGAFNLDVPDGERDFKIINTSGQTATVDTVTGGTTVSALDSVSYSIISRGTDLEEIGNNAGSPSFFGRRSEYIPAAAMQPAVTSGASALQLVEGTSGQPNAQVRDFDPSSAESVQFQFAFPNRWNKGTITFQAYDTIAGGQTGGLDGRVWGLSAVAISADEAWDTAFGTQVVVTIDDSTVDAVQISSESGVVTVAGSPADDDMVFFELERVVGNGSDDMDIDARLLGIRIFWTEDQVVDD